MPPGNSKKRETRLRQAMTPKGRSPKSSENRDTRPGQAMRREGRSPKSRENHAKRQNPLPLPRTPTKILNAAPTAPAFSPGLRPIFGPTPPHQSY